MKKVHVVPDTFSAANPLKQVVIIAICSNRVLYLSVILIEFLLFVGGRGAF